MRIAKNFILQEFVPRRLMKHMGNKAALYLNPELIKGMQAIRTDLGKPIEVNNWFNYKKGGNNFRGYREPYCEVGAKYSMHKFSLAVDFEVKGMTIRDVHDYLKDREEFIMGLGFTRVEHRSHTPSWCHLDMSPTGMDKLHFFKP